MELWVRTQLKETLLKVNLIDIEYYKDEKFARIKCENDYILGDYDTKERAIEVLDEIQNLIQPPMNFIVSQRIDFDNNGEGLIGCNVLKEEPKIERISDAIVYQMPKE